MAPVDHGGDTGVDAGERSHQIGDVDVAGAKMVREPAMHSLAVLRHRPVTGDAAQPRLPGMNVTVDQAGDHDHFGSINDICIGRLDCRTDCGDAIILH